jgi:enoyl-CoA hydratase/carnithine racemase
MTDQVRVTVDKGVQSLTLNRADKKNALNAAMYQALADGLDRAERDPAIRVTLITGTGGAFTSGTDVSIFAAASAAPLDSAEPGNPFVPSLMAAEKPVVAAVNGIAVGIGVTMLLHCDLVYAAKSATFQLPFVRLGLVPELGSSLLLPRLIGLQKAADLFLLAKKIDAEQAEALGLVAEIFADRALRAEALARAQALAAMPPNAVRIVKALLRGPDRERLAAQIEAEDSHFFPQMRSAEAKEAFSAFFEKRPADFSKLS